MIRFGAQIRLASLASLGVAAALLAHAAIVAAQEPAVGRRRGVWGSLALGAGAQTRGCPGCAGRELAAGAGGIAAHAALGVDVAGPFGLGLGVLGWEKPDFAKSGVGRRSRVVLLVAQYAPTPSTALRLSGGRGTHQEDAFGGGRAVGAMLGGGLSVAWPPRSRAGIELAIDYAQALSGRYTPLPWLTPAVGSYRPRIVSATLGVAFRTRRR